MNKPMTDNLRTILNLLWIRYLKMPDIDNQKAGKEEEKVR